MQFYDHNNLGNGNYRKRPSVPSDEICWDHRQLNGIDADGFPLAITRKPGYNAEQPIKRQW